MHWAKALEAACGREVQGFVGEGSRSGCGLPEMHAVQILDLASEDNDTIPEPARYLVVMALDDETQILDSLPNQVNSRVTISVKFVSDPDVKNTEVITSAWCVDVPDYNVSTAGKFRQILVNSNCSGAVLVASQCFVVVSLPKFDENMENWITLQGQTYTCPKHIDLVKVLWHPQSDTHIGALLSDNTFSLFNVESRRGPLRPEAEFEVGLGTPRRPGEVVADFVFGAPGMPGCRRLGFLDLWTNPSVQGFHKLVSTAEAAWLAMAVIFVTTHGRLSFRSPVWPSSSILPSAAVEAIGRRNANVTGVCDLSHMAQVQEWLQSVVPSSGPALPRAKRDEYVDMQHALHANGNTDAYRRRWQPAEQTFEEEVTPANSTTKNQGRYCSLALLAHTPFPVLARATTTGIVELVIASGAIAPKFQSSQRTNAGARNGTLECTVFEEISLATGHSDSSYLKLVPAPALDGGRGALLLAWTRSSIVAIESQWVTAFVSGDQHVVNSLPKAAITTLHDQCGSPGGVLGLQLAMLPARCAGPPSVVSSTAASAADPCCCLFCWKTQCPPNAQGSSSDLKTTMKATSLYRVLSANARQEGRAETAPAVKANKGRKQGGVIEEHIRDLSSSMLLPSPLFGSGDGEMGAEAFAKSLERVREGQLAGLIARQDALALLSARCSAKAGAVKGEMTEAHRSGVELRKDVEDQTERLKELRKRQEAIESKFEFLIAAFRGDLETRALEGVATDEIPKLWSHMHDLRHAFSTLCAAAVGPDLAEDAACKPGTTHLVTVADLQHAWACTSSARLRSQAADAEQAVAAALHAASPPERVVET